MRFTILCATVAATLFVSLAFASPPAPNVSKDVHVLTGATPSQCSSSWSGRGGPNTQDNVSGYGQTNSMVSTAVKSCTGCGYDANSHDCVCATCYSYTN
jgi:hypothetical protein